MGDEGVMLREKSRIIAIFRNLPSGLVCMDHFRKSTELLSMSKSILAPSGYCALPWCER